MKRSTLVMLGLVVVLAALGLAGAAPGDTTADEPSGPPRKLEGDLWADTIIGQPDFSEIAPYSTVPNKVFIPHGVVIDRSSTPQRMYVYDAGNSRVLGFDWDSCLASNDDPLSCSADIVIGQPSMSTSACNGDSGFQSYPDRAPASASTLCGLNEDQLSTGEGGSASSMVVDSQGTLYVPDFWNSRVLKYINPFETDTVADDVWGQSDFTGNTCNRGNPSPDATTLCFGGGPRVTGMGGVDVDGDGNIWIADNGNHRVLRFPPNSKTANLVLGQPNFTSNTNGSALDQLDAPSAVRMGASGNVYVADTLNHRILVYTPPFTSGMDGEVFGSDFAYPKTVEVNPTEEGGIWITNSDHRTVELWDEDGTWIREVGRRDVGNILGDVSGSVGVDSSGNVLAATGGIIADNVNDVLLFKKEDPLETYDDTFVNVFGPGPGNLKDANELGASRGVVVAGNQVIVADVERLMFWDNLVSLTNGEPASGLAGFDPDSLNPEVGVELVQGEPVGRSPGCCWVMKADKATPQQNLWVAVDGYGSVEKHIDVFHLPLDNGDVPYKTITLPLPVLGLPEEQISSMSPWGLVPTDNADFLWITDSDNSRVFRVRDPLGEDPSVDVILGQTDATGTECNQGIDRDEDGRLPKDEEHPVEDATDSTLCWPGSLSLDRLGNLYVSDQSLEIRGNVRLLEFDEESLPTDNTSVIYAPVASKIFPDVAAWEPAFDSYNRMVVGTNGYGPPAGKGPFPGVYNDPLSSSTTADAYLNDFHSLAFAATFDSNDNLYVGDGIRARALIYDRPFATDEDGDGCTASMEGAGAPEPEPGFYGGFSDSVWYDFFDVPAPPQPDPAPNGSKNKIVDISDAVAVLFYFGANDGAGLNGNGVSYNSLKGSCFIGGVQQKEGLCYDRTRSVSPTPPWVAGAPNGYIDISDALLALSQFGMDCVGPP